MAATTIASGYPKYITPGEGEACLILNTASTADSGDTLDVTGYFNTVDAVYGYTATVGIVLTTEASGTITIDSGGGRTNTTYTLIIWGKVNRG